VGNVGLLLRTAITSADLGCNRLPDAPSRDTRHTGDCATGCFMQHRPRNQRPHMHDDSTSGGRMLMQTYQSHASNLAFTYCRSRNRYGGQNAPSRPRFHPVVGAARHAFLVGQTAETLAHVDTTLGAVIITFIGAPGISPRPSRRPAEDGRSAGSQLPLLHPVAVCDEESEGLVRRVPSGSGSSPLVSTISARSR
jgi:hypothetical protein